MDFFATGGFQQLFSDLDEQHEQLQAETDMQAQYQDFALEPQHDSGFYMLDSYEDSSSLHGSNSSSYNDNNNNNNNNNSNNSHLLTADYELLSSCNDKITSIHLLDLNDSTADYNNNHNNLSDLQFDHCLDYLLPLDSASFDAQTPTRLIQEVAEWEAQFLDNYIEIPELVDFLPEKTPLCTDTCELFLHESSKNLRLFRGKHKTKSNAFANDLKASCGYPCNFGSCQKIYAKPAHLKAHLRRHLGEKPYICTWPECTWKFSRSDELARHRRSHSGVKPYKCDYCTKCFARSDHLAKHRKVHERRLLAANKAGCGVNGPDGALPSSVFNVRPGRKRKNQPC